MFKTRGLLPISIIAIAVLVRHFMTTKVASPAIVVGGGLAGLSAASQLISHKVPVCLLERAPKTGGNSIKASSGINGAPTKYQPVPLTDNAFYDDTIRSAGSAMATVREQRQNLISAMTTSSAAAIDWLVEEKGIDLSHVAQLGGHSLPRTHRGAGPTPPGAALVTTLLKSLQSSPLFELKTSSAISKVLKDGNQVVGVEYTSEGETKQLHGPVIFATGGFAGDAEGLLAKYRPDLTGFPSTNDPRPGTQHLLTEVGAQLLDMDLVQVHPTGFVDPKSPLSPLKFLAAESLRGEGAILLLNGKRFVNEMETRKHVTEVITATPPTDESPRQWDLQLVVDEGTHAIAASHVGFYLFKGLMQKTTVGELGPSMVSVLQEYADIVSGQAEDPFGRKTFGDWSLKNVTPDSVIYVGRVTPVIHFTMGGVIINEKSQVLGADGVPIPGLWAGGEVTGGIHGENRLGGSSLLECVVFGRRAGDGAAAYYQAKYGNV